MEVTNGLLSNLVHTKAIESVLAPIASQISLLIILDEADGGSLGLCEMGPCAQTVMKAAESLIQVGKERAKHSKDQDYSRQMLSACEILDLASSNLYIASQRLAMDNRKETRTKIVTAAKDVLQGTMKVLLVSDDAEVKKIVSAANLVTENVQRLGTVDSMSDLLIHFKSFTDSAGLLGALVNRRQKELCHKQQREKVILSLSVLQKCIPSMSVALQSYIKYPHNPQAQIGKSYVMNQVLSAVRELVEAVENTFTEEDGLEEEAPGFFVTKIDQLLEALSIENRVDLHRELDVWTEATVRHSMLVAHLCTDHNRDIIVKACQRILQLRTNVIRLYYTSQENLELDSVRQDFDVSCETLSDEFCELEKSVNMSLLNLMVDVFKETSEPLERLVKASMVDLEVSATDRFSDYVTEFEDHAEKMCQVGNLAAASSTDAHRVRIIRTCVYRLEKLDPDIIPATVAMTKHPNDKMAVKHVKLLMKEWVYELSKLLQALDEMTEPTAFMQISEKRIENDVAVCRGFLSNQDGEGVATMVQSIIGRGRRMCQMAERIINSSPDPLYRNGLLVYVKQLQKVIPGVRVACNNVLDSMSSSQYKETLQHRLTQLMDRVAQVREGLTEEGQPHILSQQRRNIRKSAMCNKKPKESRKSSQQMFSSLQNIPSNKFSQSLSQLRKTPMIPQSLSATYPTMQSSPRGHLVKEKFHEKSSAPQVFASSTGKELHVKESVTSDLSTESGKLTKRILESARTGKTSEAELVAGEMLGWSNHIEDSGRMVAKYATPTTERTILELCDLVHDLVCKICEQCDVGNPQFVQDCHTWNSQVERLRIFIDAMISEQKQVTDDIVDSAIGKNRKVMTIKVQHLQEHQKCLCDMVSLTQEYTEFSQSTTCLNVLSRLQDNGEELDGITITMVTTTEMITLSDDSFEMSQLDQLGREWAVIAFCIVRDLDHLTVQCMTLGSEVAVWGWSQGKGQDRQQGQGSHQELMAYIEGENKRYKRLLHCSCMGDEEKCTEGQNLYQSMSESNDLLTSTVAMENSTDQGQTVMPSYLSQRLDVIIAGWILKAVQCLTLIKEQVGPCSDPVDRLLNKANKSANKPSHKDRQLCISDLNAQISLFSENLVKMRQKTLSGIQLSTDLEKRSMVRKCLDQLTEHTPKMLESLKLLAAGDETIKKDDVGRSVLDWSVKVKQLLTIVQQMKDVKPTLAKGKILEITMTSHPQTESVYRDTLAGNAQPSGALLSSGTLDLPRVSSSANRGVREVDSKGEPTSMHKERQTQSTRDEMHAELLQFTKANDPGVGQMSRSERRGFNRDSPYKPSSSITAAARYLQEEADRWEDECNPVVQVAMAMSNQMQQMMSMCKREKDTEDDSELTKISIALAENGEKMREFAKILSKYCIDKRASSDLELYANQVQIYCKQLTILSNVQMASPRSSVTDKILMQNAQNLMTVIKQTMKAAEAACVKGLNAPEDGDEAENCAIILTTQWKRKLDRYRQAEMLKPQRDDLGLRRMERDMAPQLSHIFNRK
ncbi:hypothetical protein FSP39_008190 [Pinctada imbricata]|uniref:Vinculin n=1 Tax=Pinctada imbricata TaxID=66713 RepID=A0AA88XJM4_PINIB|nr:hypothetical protein FSP39_008190 [Pinctada imbricata]